MLFEAFKSSSVIVLGASCIVGSYALAYQAQFEVAVSDECYAVGYSDCVVKDGVLVPSTRDPKINRELTKFVRQLNREARADKRAGRPLYSTGR